ncbi:MAG: hypothetical protein KDK91_06240 [Gammaproteobacteria bacterium]|nr:hypothetical protein [Gammaproteobacteria bacterium]
MTDEHASAYARALAQAPRVPERRARKRLRKHDSDYPASLFLGLLERYEEPERRYHTPAHLEHCLSQFDLVRERLEDTDAVELAIWFHDAIYVAGAKDNEQLSADYFERCARGQMPEWLIQRVVELILITQHRAPPVTADQCYLIDIDLSSFGLPWKAFLRDSIAVREELVDVPDKEFFPVQRLFLESLLARDRFCFTEFFHRRHEKRARDNIRKYLDRFLLPNI